MACPVCYRKTSDHRDCILKLFKENKIKSIAEWTKLCSTPVKLQKFKIVKPAN